VEYFFYSPGTEWYWQQNHGVRTGNFRSVYLSGFQLTRGIRVTPSLLRYLWQGHYDVFVKDIDGRFALPVTYLMARLRRKPFVLWTGVWMTLQTPAQRWLFPLTRWLYRHADAIVVYGEHVKNYLGELNIPTEKIFVAAHAVDNAVYSGPVCEHAKAALRAKLGLGSSKVVLYLGRLEESKGVDFLMRAFALLHPDDAILVVAGDGSHRPHLEALVMEEGLQHKVRFAGYVSPEETVIYYAIAELFVLPSVTMPSGKEPWGLVVNEVMNQGVPVVATTAVGAAAGGLVQHGVNGFIVPERDSGALAEEIKRILRNTSLREELSQNARHMIAAWDNERMVQGFQQAITYALQRHTCV
jgi:glycosyltransferase involved in cell wall biosynthesis